MEHENIKEYEKKKVSDFVWEIPQSEKPGMNVPARVYASKKLLDEMDKGVFEQLTNVACMPGIKRYAIAMPDAHWGYGANVGATVAFDLKEGVVSPGVVGFDINCLAGNSRILTEHGFWREISSFDKNFEKDSLKCFSESEIKNSNIQLFLKKHSDKIFKITTESGKEILVTKDHPILTKNGMIEAEKLKEGQSVCVYGFEGVKFEQPSQKILADEEDIKKMYKGNQNGLNQILSFLKKKDLLPLRSDNPKLPYIVKIMGFVFGDGCLSLLKNGKMSTGFYGKKEDLKDIRQDIEKIGFKAGKIYTRMRNHSIKTMYGTMNFEYEENSIRCGAIAFAVLLKCLGTPSGEKTREKIQFPKWLLEEPLWQKRLFLAALFGAELTTPKTNSWYGYNFNGPVLSLNKKIWLRKAGLDFLEQIQSVLKEFNVESSLINDRVKFVNAKGEISLRQRLQISSIPENLCRLWKTVGFEYNRKKQFMGLVAAHYIEMKSKLIEKRKDSILQAIELKTQGLTIKQIAKTINSEFINERFIARSIWEGRKTSPRISSKFEKFNDFLQKATAGLPETGQSWDNILSIKEIEWNDFVYDFTIENSAHNFSANSLVVHNCGMRLIRTNLHEKDVRPKTKELVNALYKNVPVGVGGKSKFKLNKNDFADLMTLGVKWCENKGYGWSKDHLAIEEHGKISGADPSKVSEKAFERGLNQLGTLGSGNHYLEVQVVPKGGIADEKIAKVLGIVEEGQVVIMVHCGSRGFGHQVATDYLTVFEKAMQKYGIKVNDRQLACAPFESQEGKEYYAAMACAANNAFANRQVIAHQIRESFKEVFKTDPEKLGMEIIYDVAHNIAKIERHFTGEKTEKVIVHRKGATRSFEPGHEELWGVYSKVGQPVIVGGSMETGSYLCVGTKRAMQETFGSTMHGSGRTMSRAKAKKMVKGEKLQKDMEKRGIFVKAASYAGLAEEAGLAYKDISEVVNTMHNAGISLKVTALKPIGNIKG